MNDVMLCVHHELQSTLTPRHQAARWHDAHHCRFGRFGRFGSGRSLNPWQSLRYTADIAAVMIAPVSRCCLWMSLTWAQMRWHHSADSGSTGCDVDVCKESYQEGNTMEIYRTIYERDYDHLMSWYPELPNNLRYSVCSLAVSMHKSISHAGWGRRRKQCCEVTKNRFSDFVFARQRHCVCILMLLSF